MAKRQRRSLFPQGQLCYLCQAARATTEDHVPPEGFFPKGQRKGYTVPACRPCNNRFSKDDEYVRDSFALGAWNREGYQVFRDRVRPSYLRPYERLKPVTKLDQLLANLKSEDITTAGGIYLGTAQTIPMKIARISRFLVRTVKGLQFQWFKTFIPHEYQITPYFETPELLKWLFDKPSPIIANLGNVLSYKAVIDDADEISGFWWLSFYGTHGAVVTVFRPELVKMLQREEEKVSMLRS